MSGVLRVLSLFCVILLLPFRSHSLPLCTNLKAPITTKDRLAFCPYNGKVCCNSKEDLQLRNRFQAMGINDSSCAAAVKSILCATCDPFSAELFEVNSSPRSVPLLCNSTAGTSVSSLSSNTNSNFCSSVWEACKTTPILNSPFAPELQSKAEVSENGTLSTLTDLWQSESDFCSAFSGISDEKSLCFNGEPVVLNVSDILPPPKGICLEKVDNGSFINMVAHPDGSNRAFFSSQAGKIWLANIPDQDSGATLGLDESNPFVDLTDQVHLDASFGMMGMAFHPNYATNGRFFASFNCDKEKSPSCGGRCACNSDVSCDPSDLSSLESGEPCKYHVVVAEYSANGTSSPSEAEKASPVEIRRTFTLGLPFTANHGGQILFGPADKFMYIMMGDGGSKGDPYNFAQNKKSLLGKIIRIDVDNIPSEEDIVKLNIWGNYSIPQDNPFTEDKEMEHEIWAYGLKNPWRCSFDSNRPSYFMCADVGQDQYEEVNVISKGGNYGWRVFEGPLPFQPSKTPGGNTSAASINPIFPVVGYNHSSINKLGSAAISGGYFYRAADTDPCTYGSYLYGDLYASHIWAASETPQNSGNFTTSDISFSCAADSPIGCESVPNSDLPALKFIFSFGEDNKKDVYILTQSGVYRVVRPSRCNFACSKEVSRPAKSPSPSPPSEGYIVSTPHLVFMLLVSLLLVFYC